MKMTPAQEETIERLQARIAELEKRDWDLENDALLRRADELESNLSAAHVRIAQLEKDRGAWRSTAGNRYIEIERLRARIAELDGVLSRLGKHVPPCEGYKCTCGLRRARDCICWMNVQSKDCPVHGE